MLDMLGDTVLPLPTLTVLLALLTLADLAKLSGSDFLNWFSKMGETTTLPCLLRVDRLTMSPSGAGVGDLPWVVFSKLGLSLIATS